MSEKTKTEIILISFLFFIFGAFFALFIFYFFFLPQIKEKIRKETFFQTKAKDFELLVKNANFPPEPESIVLIEGVIEKIDEKEKSFFVKILEPFDPLSYLFLNSQGFKVLVDKDTEIFSIKPEDSEKLSKALFEYNKAIQEGKEPPPFPAPYIKTKTDFSELKENQKIKVEFGDNIKFKGEGRAKLIEIKNF